MRKIGKRLLAVFLLIVGIWLIGWLVFTGSRLAKPPTGLENYQRAVFIGNDGTMVAFTDDGVWYKKMDKGVFLLKITDYTEGVITMQRKSERYQFVAIDTETIYDVGTKKLLIRRGDSG